MSPFIPSTARPRLSRPGNNGFNLRILHKHFLQALGGMVALEAALWLARKFALSRLPAGDAYILAPRGAGMFEELISMGLVITLVSAFLTVPSLMVRPALGNWVRGLMFLIFTGSILCLRLESAIAVVETADHFEFIYPYPMAPMRVGFTENYSPSGWPESGLLGIEISTSTHYRKLYCNYVSRDDPETCNVMDSLVERLKLHQLSR